SQVSKCDEDRRNIPDMMETVLEKPVLNLGDPGQSFPQALNFTGEALGRSSVKGAVVFLAMTQLSETAGLDLRDQLFLRLTAGPMHANDLGARLKESLALAAQPGQEERAFTYKGVTYPDYVGVKDTYYSAEKAAMGCPETAGTNKAFIEAIYWNNYAKSPPRAEAIADLATLNARAKAAGKSFRVVIMPIDTPDVETYDAAL